MTAAPEPRPVAIHLACEACGAWNMTDSHKADAQMLVDPDGNVTITVTCPVCQTRRPRSLAKTIARTLFKSLNNEKRVTVLPDRKLPPPGELSLDTLIDAHFNLDQEYEGLCSSAPTGTAPTG